MKPKSTTVVLAALLFSAITVNADTITWDGGGADDNWGTSDNWGVGTQFDSLDSLIFAGSTRLTPNNEAAGRTVNGITFDAAAGAFILGGNAITLGGNIGFSAAPAVAIIQTINMDLQVSVDRTVSSRSGTGSLVLGGVISGAGGLIKGQLGTVTLSAVNEFTGNILVTAGGLSFATIADSGVNCNLGAGSQITLGNGPNVGFIINTGSGISSTNRTVQIGSGTAANSTGGAGIRNSGSGTLDFTAPNFNTPETGVIATSTRILNLEGTNTGANKIQGIIQDNTVGASGTAAVGVTKSNSGSWTLTGNNTFTGNVSVNEGTLTVNSVADSGTASALGAGTTINLGSGTTTAGTLNYTGTGGLTTRTTNRSINLAATTTGGATITNNGANGGSGLVFNGTFANAGTGAKTLILAGSNIDANDFQSVIGNGSGTLTVQKNGIGIWTLSGNNTFTGNLVIGTGTVKVSTLANSGSPSNAGAGSLIRIGGGTFGGVLDYTGSGSTTNRTIQIGNNSGTPGLGDIGSARIRNNGSGALIFNAPNFNATGLTGSLAPSRPLILGGDNTGNNEIQGVIADGLDGTMKTDLTKENDGTWILSGTSTYTGITSVAGGKLVINGNHSAASGGVFVNNGGTLAGTGTLGGNLTVQSGGHQLFAVASTPGAQVARSVTGVLDLQAGHILDLTAASTPANGSYTLITATGGITGAVGTVNLTDFTGTVAVSGDSKSLILTVGATSDYDTWKTVNGVTGGPNDDDDGDGVKNFGEYAFGLNPKSGASANPVSSPLDKTTGLFKYTRRKQSLTGLAYTYESSITLAGAWPSFTPDSATSNGGDPVEEITVDVPNALLASPALFIRVKAVQP